MSKCSRCGYKSPLNPFGPLMTCFGQLMMLWFLSHVTPDAASWGGSPNFFINWHWLMWWFVAFLAALSGTVFFLSVAALVVDRDHEHSRT